MPKRGEKAEEAQVESAATETKETKEKTGTKKLPLTEKVKKYFDKINPALNQNVHEMNEQVVKDSEGNKNNCVFVVFTDKSNKEAEGQIVEERNVELIKDALFGYHTLTDEKPGSKVLELSVIPPDPNDEGSVHILCVQEF